MPRDDGHVSLDDLIGRMDGVLGHMLGQQDPPRPAQAVTDDLDERIALIAARLLGDGEGRQLLDYLCDRTIRRPHVYAQMSADQRDAWSLQREGQNQTLYLILRLIAAGRSKPPPVREGNVL